MENHPKSCRNSISPGDIVNVKGGVTYSEKVTPSTSGTLAGGYITYQAWSGTGIPIVDATGQTHGFYLDSKKYLTISRFLIKNASAAGIEIHHIMVSDYIIIENNICINNDIGIYNSYSNNNIFYNNILYNNASAGFHSDGGIYTTGLVLKNNIAVNNGSFGGFSVSSGIPITSDYNDSWNNTGSNYANITPGAHDLSQDPLLIDASNSDFRFLANSALINAGTTLSEVTTDILGVIRPQGSGYDIGAYEYDGVLGEQVSIEPLPQNPVRASNLTLLSHIDGESAGDQFGMYVGGPNMTVTDANDDGYDDLIAGARYHYSGGVDHGGIYVFNGKSNFTDVSATNADTIIRESVYGAFGELNMVDDITGDGIPELISSHYRGLPGHIGNVYIFNKSILTSGTGSSTQAVATIKGSSSTARFGVYGTVLGDINSDGIKDYVFSGAIDTKAYVFYGEPTISSKNATNASTIYTNDINGEAMSYVKSQFDINDDGYKDIGIICTTCATKGALYIFKGGPSLTSKNISQADIIITGAIGKNVSAQIVAGDFDGDGNDDLVFGSSSLYLFKGKSDFTSTQITAADTVISTSDPDSPSGTSISSLFTADINNDSCPDLVLSNSIPRIYVLYGCSLSTSGLSSPNLIYVGSGDMSYLVGSSFESGDINGDGYKEIFASDPIYQSGNYKGRIYVLGIPHGSPSITTTSVGGESKSGKVTGTVTDSYTLGAVEVSTDNGSWSNCSLSSDGIFSCSLPESDAGSNHTLRIRYKNSLGVYISEREYKTINFNFLTKAGTPNNTCSSTLSTSLTPTITNLKSLNNRTSVKLTLKNKDLQATEYVIEYGTNKTNLNYSALGIPVTTKTYIINKLNPNKNYYFKIRSSSGCAVGKWSNPVAINNDEIKETKLTPIPKAGVKPTSISTVTNQKNNISIFQTIWNYVLKIFNK